MKTILLTNSDRVALVDDVDYEDVSQFSWMLDSKGYAFRNLPRNGGKTKHQYLHSYLLGTKPGFEIDHKDTNKLNNQRGSNLRHATHAQNNANRKKLTGASSRYKGVFWHKATGKWQAQIGLNGLQLPLGYFVIEEAAAHAYDRKALELFGEFARLNFPRV